MSVPRYIATRVRPGSTVNAAFERVVVLFTDHEAALAAARDERDAEMFHKGHDAGFNAALDAVRAAAEQTAGVGTWSLFGCLNALRKQPPQPEPLTREEQNERWRQDYNTQARLRKVGDWRLTEYPKPFDDAAAAQPEGGESHG